MEMNLLLIEITTVTFGFQIIFNTCNCLLKVMHRVVFILFEKKKRKLFSKLKSVNQRNVRWREWVCYFYCQAPTVCAVNTERLLCIFVFRIHSFVCLDCVCLVTRTSTVQIKSRQVHVDTLQNAAHLGCSTDGDAEHVVASHQVAAGRVAATVSSATATVRAVNLVLVLFDVAAVA